MHVHANQINPTAQSDALYAAERAAAKRAAESTRKKLLEFASDVAGEAESEEGCVVKLGTREEAEEQAQQRKSAEPRSGKPRKPEGTKGKRGLRGCGQRYFGLGISAGVDAPISDGPAFDEPAINSRRYSMFWWHGFAELHAVGDSADELREIGWFDVSLTMLGSDALISRARSTLVAAFLDNPEATHLLFVDADISFEPLQVERMLRFDKDFAGALYPLKSMDWDLVPQRCVERGESVRQAALSYVGTFSPDSERKQEGDFVTGLYAGGGFQLIRRGALKKMIAAYPETRFSRVHDLPISGSRRNVVRSSNLFALFDCIIDPGSGTYLSEDYSFCLRWRRIGGEIWIDAASKLNHCGPYEFVGDHASRFFPASLQVG
jgi:hypothetical protein